MYACCVLRSTAPQLLALVPSAPQGWCRREHCWEMLGAWMAMPDSGVAGKRTAVTGFSDCVCGWPAHAVGAAVWRC